MADLGATLPADGKPDIAISDDGARRRILVVLPHLAVGGAESHLVQVLPRLDRRRFAVSVCATHGPGRFDADMRRAGIAVDAPPRERNGLNAVPAKFLHVLRAIRRARPDLVHFFLPQAYIVGGLAAVLLGIRPRIMSRRSLNAYQAGKPLAARFEHWLHKRMDRLVANSSAVAAELRSEGVPASRITTIVNGIDTARFAGTGRAPARAALGLADDEVAIVSVANLIPYKGHADLVAALGAARLPPRWRCLLVGRNTRNVGPALDAQAASLGLAGLVVRLGERNDVPAILAAADIVVLASHEEGSPNSVAEAMASGCAVIATRVGGSAELIADGRTGLLVPARDPAALAAALTGLAGDAPLRARLGSAAREHIVRHHALGDCVTAYEALYESLLPPPVVGYAGSSGQGGRDIDA